MGEVCKYFRSAEIDEYEFHHCFKKGIDMSSNAPCADCTEHETWDDVRITKIWNAETGKWDELMRFGP